MVAERVTVRVSDDGTLTFIYKDGLKALMEAGPTVVKRASYVEPEQTAEGVKWFADLAPVDGPKLGPFDTRDEALQEEVGWIIKNVIQGDQT